VRLTRTIPTELRLASLTKRKKAGIPLAKLILLGTPPHQTHFARNHDASALVKRSLQGQAQRAALATAAG